MEGMNLFIVTFHFVEFIYKFTSITTAPPTFNLLQLPSLLFNPLCNNFYVEFSLASFPPPEILFHRIVALSFFILQWYLLLLYFLILPRKSSLSFILITLLNVCHFLDVIASITDPPESFISSGIHDFCIHIYYLFQFNLNFKL